MHQQCSLYFRWKKTNKQTKLEEKGIIKGVTKDPTQNIFPVLGSESACK